jgi:diadenosine tetraphosphate (Ap4A) HIT family hydrolase
MDRCLACATLNGRVEVPGGVVWEDAYWVADHCLGPFPPGSLVLKTRRHCESLPELSDAEAAALGPAIRTLSSAMMRGLPCERAYIGAWVDAPPLHVHFVLEPRFAEEEGADAWELQAARRRGAPAGHAQAADAAVRIRGSLEARANRR